MGHPSIPRLVCRLAIVGGLLSVSACQGPVGPNRAQSASPAEGSPATTRISNEEGEADSGSRVLPVFMIGLSGRQVSRGVETAGDLQVIEDHDGSLTDLASREVTTRSPVSLEIHGDISTTLAKKSYRLELVDDEQEDRDLPLLGLPPGSDWVLHSCGFDPTCLRNVLAYELARQFGHYAPRTRFIVWFVDDAYLGLYVLI
jgi:hypothetical protein